MATIVANFIPMTTDQTVRPTQSGEDMAGSGNTTVILLAVPLLLMVMSVMLIISRKYR